MQPCMTMMFLLTSHDLDIIQASMMREAGAGYLITCLACIFAPPVAGGTNSSCHPSPCSKAVALQHVHAAAMLCKTNCGSVQVRCSWWTSHHGA